MPYKYLKDKLKNNKKWQLENKEAISLQKRDYYKRIKKQYPYLNSFKNAKQRCNNKSCKDYKNYGAKGIKFLLTKEKIKELWIRDKAYDLKRASIDRIDSKGNYEFDNCRFIELSENVKLSKAKAIKQISFDGELVRIWESKVEVVRKFPANSSNLLKAIRLSKKYKGYYWSLV